MRAFRTFLLIILTLSFFVVAVVELSGISTTAVFDRCNMVPRDYGFDPLVSEREKQVSAMRKTKIQFLKRRYNFGAITEGNIIRHVYKFKNIGNNPLVIAKTEASCGCTTPSFSKDPVLPGQEGEIVVQFNSENKTGHQLKSILVTANTDPETTMISFDIDVKPR